MSYVEQEKQILDELKCHIAERAFPIDYSPLGHSAVRAAELLLQLAESLLHNRAAVNEAVREFMDHLHGLLRAVDALEDPDMKRRILDTVPKGSEEGRGDRGWERNLMNAYLRQPLMIQMLNEEVTALPGRVNRVGELLDVLIDTELPIIPRRYLARAARLFIHGMRLESLVFSRSALEAALKVEVPDDRVRSTVGGARGGEIGVSARIRAAHALGRLDAESASKAREVVEAANHILHQELALLCGDQSVKAYLEKLRDVFVCLERTSG